MKLPIRKYSLPVAIAAGALSAGSARGEVDFAKDIYPVLQERCIECHGPDKQKADLRLDSQEAAHEFSIVPGNVEESELYYRISLPADDDDIMPPKGDPLTAEQIAAFKEWIEAGGEYAEVEPEPEVAAAEPAVDFDKEIRPILDNMDPEARAKILEWVASGGQVPVIEAREPELTPFEITEAEEQAIAAIKETGALAMRVAQDVDYAMANFRLVGEDITDESIQPLGAVKNLIDLDLSKTSVTNDGLAVIEGLSNLTRLDLNNTAITDEGLKHVAGLTNLVYLNLYGTAVTDAGLGHLKGLKSLQKLFLWQSQVTKEGAESLKAELPWLDVNLGVELTEAPAEEEAAEEPAEEAAEPAEEKAEAAEPEEAAVEPAPSAPAISIADALLLISRAEPVAQESIDAKSPSGLSIAQASLIVADAPAIQVAEAPVSEPVSSSSVAQVLLKVADAPAASGDSQPMSLKDALSFLSGAKSE